jgi:hypothetical protein
MRSFSGTWKVGADKCGMCYQVENWEMGQMRRCIFHLTLSGILSPFLELLEAKDFNPVAEGLLAFVRWELDLNVERKDLEAKVS